MGSIYTLIVRESTEEVEIVKPVLAVILTLLLSVTAYGQQNVLVGLTYNVSFPTSDMKDFIDKTSFAGYGFEGRGFIKPNFSYGLYFGWNNFDDELNSGTNTEELRSLDVYPITLIFHYYFQPEARIAPYIGTGIGPYRIDQRIKTSNLSPKKVRWHFGVAPDVGLRILLSSSVNALLSLKYHYAFEADGATFSGFGLNFGLAYALVTD